MEFPVTHDSCPVCGSEVKLGLDYIKELKREGKLSKSMPEEGLVIQVPLIDPTRPPSVIYGAMIKVPVLMVYWDVCECGIMYSTKIDCIDTPAQVQQQLVQPPKKAPLSIPPSSIFNNPKFS